MNSGFDSYRVSPVESYQKRVTYGIANLGVGSNEDAFAIYTDHGKDNQGDMASFAVFDGHNGKKSADFCSERIPRMVIQSYNRLIKAKETLLESKQKVLEKILHEDSKESNDMLTWHKDLEENELHDAMLCEAYRATCQYADRRLRLTTQSGSTMSSLTLRFDPRDGTTHVYCANVGDSRTVMVMCDESMVSEKSFRGGGEGMNSPLKSMRLGRSVEVGQSTSNRRFLPTEYESQSRLESLDDTNHSDIAQSIKESKIKIKSQKVTLEHESSNRKNVTDESNTIPSDPIVTDEIKLEHLRNSNHSETTITDSDMTDDSLRGGNKFGIDILSVSKHTDSDTLNSSTHSAITTRRTSKLVLMSEDHVLSLERERMRVLRKEEITLPALPVPALPDLNRTIPTTISSINTITSLGESNKLQVAEDFIKSLVKVISENDERDAKYFSKINFDDPNGLIDYTPIDEPEDKDVFGKRTSNLESSNGSRKGTNSPVIRMIREESFVARRRGPNGEIGPEAVFGRYNVSVMMTRSLGDRYGPRCCHGIPDIRHVTIPYHQHSRFVIASDGLWDVITTEFIRCNALRTKFIHPQLFANYLANKAKRLRQQQGMRMDDITVIIVDINGGNTKNTVSSFKAIDSAAGTDVVVDGISSTGCMDTCLYGPTCTSQ